jgi:hypothetical protein
MVSLISTSETVAPASEGNNSCEVWASADARYSYTMSRLEVKLDSFLQRSRDGKRVKANWLPGVRKVASTVPFEESATLARKIFAEWTEQVAEATKGVEPSEGLAVATNGAKEN